MYILVDNREYVRDAHDDVIVVNDLDNIPKHLAVYELYKDNT